MGSIADRGDSVQKKAKHSGYCDKWQNIVEELPTYSKGGCRYQTAKQAVVPDTVLQSVKYDLQKARCAMVVEAWVNYCPANQGRFSLSVPLRRLL